MPATQSDASYIRIGQLVHLYLHTYVSSIPNNNTTFQIGGLPFTPNTTFLGGSDGAHYGGGGLSYVAAFEVRFWSAPLCTNNNTYMYFHRHDNNGDTVQNLNVTGIPALICNAHYITKNGM